MSGRLARAAAGARELAADLLTNARHWREWSADYRYLAGARLRGVLRAARLPVPSGAVRDVVVLPGIYETPADLGPLTAALAAGGHRIHRVPGLARQLIAMSELTRRVASYARRTNLSHALILAHSKGGLLGKAVLNGPQGHRFDGMIAVATPWHGSRYAALFWPGLGVRSLRPSSRLIAAAAVPSTADGRTVTISPAFDPHVPLGSALAGALNLGVRAAGHFKSLAAPETIALVTDLAAHWEDRYDRHAGDGGA